MERTLFGNTGITVSRLGLGTDVLGLPRELGPTPAEYALVLRRAFDLGVNFWDASDDYGTHPHIRLALQGLDRGSVVISTKTWARDGTVARRSLESSLAELGTSYVDIFLMHGIRPDDVDTALRTIEALQQAKNDGLVRAVSLTTHYASVANRAAAEAAVEVVYVTLNPIAHDIDDGLLAGMIDAAARCHAAGKGVCTMKALALGRLVHDLAPTLRFSLDFPYSHSTLVGMRSIAELEADVAIAEGRTTQRQSA